MAEPLELPEGWPEDSIEYLVRHRLDRELEASMMGDRIRYEEARSRMPAAVRHREDRVVRRHSGEAG